MNEQFEGPDWFSQHIPTWKTYLLGLIQRKGAKVLEIGCLEGRSTVWLLKNVVGKSGKMWCIDPWEPYDEFPEGDEAYWKGVENRFRVNTHYYRHHLEILKGKSSELLPYLLSRLVILPCFMGYPPGDNSLDLIYVDGAHDSRSVLFDLLLSWQLLKPGGLLIADDYLWGTTAPDGTCPQEAIDMFVKVYLPELHILHKNVQVILMKKRVVIERELSKAKQEMRERMVKDFEIWLDENYGIGGQDDPDTDNHV